MSEASLREHKNCNICGSDEKELLYHWDADVYPHNEIETCSWDGRQSIDLSIVKCKNCGLVFTSPAFKPENLGLVYPADIIPEKIEINSNEKKFVELGDEIKKFLPAGSTLLDVGARYGAFIKRMTSMGYTSFGVEYNPEAVERAKEEGIDGLFTGTIDSLPDALHEETGHRFMDAFVMDDVLEHLTDPVKDITILNGLQEIGGKLFLRQMDLDSWGHRLYGKNWYYLQPAAHMYFFNEDSIKRLLKKVGYRVVSIRRASFMKVLFSFLQNSISGKSEAIINGKPNYLNYRKKLRDMFLVIAEKERNLT